MKADRMARVNSLLKNALAELLQRGAVKDPRVSRPAVVAIVDVRTSPDLQHAKVYLSITGGEEERSAALSGLRAARGYLRGEIGRTVRLRAVPELRFEIDEAIDKAARIEEILREVAAERVEVEAGDAGEGGEAGGDSGEEGGRGGG